MIFKRFSLFQFFGYTVKADASWIFLSFLICWTLSTSIFPGLYVGHDIQVYQIMSVMTLIGLILSILAHEVAHAIIAEHYNMPILSITLFIFGGVAEMKGPPSHPKGEFLMALAGPAMSALMGGLFFAGEWLYEVNFGMGAISIVFGLLGHLNIVIALFNVIPAFPLDGGRALRAVIWYYKNNLVLATRIVSGTGYLFSYGLMSFACYLLAIDNDLLSGIWAAFLGLFIHGAASYSVTHVENQSVLAKETVKRFLQVNVQTLSPDMPLTTLVDDYAYRQHQKIFPVVDQGSLIGVVKLQDVMNIDRRKWQWLHVSSIMEPIGPQTVIAPDVSADEALDLLQRTGQDAVVVAQGRTLQGTITFKDLMHYLSTTRTLDRSRMTDSGKKAY